MRHNKNGEQITGKGFGLFLDKMRRFFTKETLANGNALQDKKPFIAAINSTIDGHPAPYDKDGLKSVHNHEFENDAFFVAAYRRGVQAVSDDYNWHWRVHIGLWAAYTASRLKGDFVECGVNKGFMSSAIMKFLDWNKTDKTFFLLDTFCGIDIKHLQPSEIEAGFIEKNRERLDEDFYTVDPQSVIDNFSEWNRVKIIVGTVPDTLHHIDSRCIAFVHLDMNCAAPEVAAIEYLWDRIVTGGIVLFDDYGYSGFRNQKIALDTFANSRRIAIASLPTGQGLVVKN